MSSLFNNYIKLPVVFLIHLRKVKLFFLEIPVVDL
jgi:hypothetical protein